MGFRFLLIVLATCFSCGLTDNSVRVIEDPVIVEYNSTHTAIRCSIEAGLLSPRIDFFFDNMSSSAAPFMRCNGVIHRPFTAENGNVASSCQKNASIQVRHQTVFVRTCFDDSSYQLQINSTAIYCQPISESSSVGLPSSRRVQLIYNDRREPRIVPQNAEADPLRVPLTPVCPGEPVGTLDLWSSAEASTPSPSSTVHVASETSLPDAVVPLLTTVIVASSSAGNRPDAAQTVFASGPGATPLDQTATPYLPSPTSSLPSPASATISPSLAPTPVPPNESEDLFSALTEAELRVIIFIAAGVAALFAIVVLCLLCTLGCVLMRRRKTSNYKRAKKTVREALTEDGSKENTIRLERIQITSTAAVNGHTNSSIRQPQQFAIHRGGSDSSSNTNSIRSDTLDRDIPLEASYDRPRDVITNQRPSLQNSATVAKVRPSVALSPPPSNQDTTNADIADHDYDYIDDSQLPTRPCEKTSKLSSSSFSGSSKGELKNAKVPPNSEYSVPRLSCVVDDSEGVPEFPVTDSHMMESGVEVAQHVVHPSSPTSRHSLAASDYQNTPTTPAAATARTDAASHYQNSSLATCGTQTIRPGGGIGDSYQELNSISDSDVTVEDSSSSSYFNHLDGFVRPNAYCTDATPDSSLSTEDKSKGLNRGAAYGLKERTSSCSKEGGSEHLYHTVLSSSTTESSDSSMDSTGIYCLPLDVQARIKASGKSSQSQTYANTSLLHHHHHSHHPSGKTASSSQPGSKPAEQHDYEDLDVAKLDGSEDYSTLTNQAPAPAPAPTTTTTTSTSISTQTYA